MTSYEDPTVVVDDDGITIRNHLLPGRSRRVLFADIVDVEVIELGFFSGRHQLVGIGPLRPRTFFHWDRSRAAKQQGIVLDVGRFLRLAVTPDDPTYVAQLLRSGIADTAR